MGVAWIVAVKYIASNETAFWQTMKSVIKRHEHAAWKPWHVEGFGVLLESMSRNRKLLQPHLSCMYSFIRTCLQTLACRLFCHLFITFHRVCMNFPSLLRPSEHGQGPQLTVPDELGGPAIPATRDSGSWKIRCGFVFVHWCWLSTPTLGSFSTNNSTVLMVQYCWHLDSTKNQWKHV